MIDSQCAIGGESQTTRSLQVRNSNLELLRIVSILLIIAMHAIGYAASKGELSDSNQYIRFFVGSFGNLGVGCFVLILGYFGVKYTTRKFVFISWLTTIYAILCAWANNDFSISRDCVMAITNVPRYFNWYITCYLILMALSGYINRFVGSLTKNEFKQLIMILFLFFSVLPMMVSATDTVLLKSGQCVTYFIYAYFIGRYIRLHRDIDVSKVKSVLMTLTFIAMLFTIKMVGVYVPAIDAIPVMSNNNPLVLGAVVSVFYLFKSFNFKSKIVNYISVSVLAVYLLDNLKSAIDNYFQVYTHTLSSDFVLFVIMEAVTIFLIAILIDKIRTHVFGKAENYIINEMTALLTRIMRKVVKL